MNFWAYSSTRPSTRCSSLPVPSVTVTMACVSPRWNTAEPCTRGSTSIEQLIGRSVLLSRPSGRVPARINSRMPWVTTACQAAENFSSSTLSSVSEAGINSALARSFRADTASARACLPSVRLACLISSKYFERIVSMNGFGSAAA